jgi:hypothetical protein
MSSRADFLDLVLTGVLNSGLRGGIVRAIKLQLETSGHLAVAALANDDAPRPGNRPARPAIRRRALRRLGD